MHKLILPLLFVAVLTASCQSDSSVTSQSVKLEQTAFIQKLESDTSAQIIDVRTPEEYENGHIEGAINVNFYDPEFERRISKLDMSKPVYVYCAAGGRSGKACEMMKKLGFVAIYDLKGGYKH